MLRDTSDVFPCVSCVLSALLRLRGGFRDGAPGGGVRAVSAAGQGGSTGPVQGPPRPGTPLRSAAGGRRTLADDQTLWSRSPSCLQVNMTDDSV